MTRAARLCCLCRTVERICFTAVLRGEAWPAQAGYLYLTRPARLHQLMVYLGLGGEIRPPA